MTDQANDLFIYRNKEYVFAACTAGEPFSPGAIGLNPTGVDTACARGYIVTYGIDDERLVVADLGVNLVVDTKDYVGIPGPPINGVTPLGKTREHYWFNNNYLGLNYPLDYSGGIVIGCDYIEDFHDGLDFVILWKFREILELRFDAGQLTGTADLSRLIEPMHELARQEKARLAALFDELRIAEQHGRKDQFPEIKEKHRHWQIDPATGLKCDELIKQRLSQVIDPAYLDR